MSGKLSERGIECSKGHLVADEDGTVVCSKSKNHKEKVPVGKMVQERQSAAEEGDLSLREKVLSVQQRKLRLEQELAQTTETFNALLKELQAQCEHPFIIETGHEAYTGRKPKRVCSACMLQEHWPDDGGAAWKFQVLVGEPVKRVLRPEFEAYCALKPMVVYTIPQGLV